ncbi:hypothetical protein [Anabaena lutea]|uniref:hypothetical protein n=1 Tax=Anabaena lutea TaxID=212350 RepID=UPI001686ED49|nr:hypothetical protein [Anabaena lutea]
MSHLFCKNSVLISVSLMTTLLVSIKEIDSVNAEVDQPLTNQKQVATIMLSFHITLKAFINIVSATIFLSLQE